MRLKTEERREEILKRLHSSEEAISAKVFAIDYQVSRQVIVQDIAVLRAAGNHILSTNRGYLITVPQVFSREFKIRHGEEQVEEELTTVVDLGGRVKNVSISHRIYGKITAELKIESRQDVKQFLEKIKDSSSKLLGDTTMGYHYHLIEASGEATLDLIEEKLREAGLLAPLLTWEKEEDYES